MKLNSCKCWDVLCVENELESKNTKLTIWERSNCGKTHYSPYGFCLKIH